jgi:hypothetical protein
MLLIYSSPATWNALSEAERAGGNALADPVLARSVQVRDGAVMVTDGPYGETKEHLAGYSLIDCTGLERALEIAARVPDAAVCRVEVRPLMTRDGPTRPGAAARRATRPAPRPPTGRRHPRTRTRSTATTRSRCCSCAATPR